MPEEDLRANIVTFIGAGHETTANALTWTFYLLSQASDWRARVEAESDAQLSAGPIDTLADRMPVTKAVLEEALRLYPPAAILTRTSINADEIGGKHIRAGTLVTVSPFLLHRHRTLWSVPTSSIRTVSSAPIATASTASPTFPSAPDARVHRHGVCAAGSDHRAGASGQRVPVRSRRRPCGAAGAADTLRPQGGMPMTMRKR